MSFDSNGFGRRGVDRPSKARPSEAPIRPAPSPLNAQFSSLLGSPLVKQAGGVLLGVVIAFSLGVTYVHLMKSAGHRLNDKFLENANPASPEDAIKQVKNVDANLLAVQQSCTAQAKTAQLSEAQTRATDGYMDLYAGESEVVRGAAFVECLASTQPARFCQAPHKAHLVEAVRQYFKLMKQMQTAWVFETSGPGVQKAVLMGTPYRLEQRVALGMPSARTSAPMLAALRVRAADGYVAAKDFGGFAGSGVPRDLADALSGVTPKTGTCG